MAYPTVVNKSLPIHYEFFTKKYGSSLKHFLITQRFSNEHHFLNEFEEGVRGNIKPFHAFFPSFSFIYSSLLMNDSLFAPKTVKLFLVGAHHFAVDDDKDVLIIPFFGCL